MAKQKHHDCLQEMTEFSRVWQTFPLLYDEEERNKLFALDYSSAVTKMKKSYEDMAVSLNLSVEQVKACRVKYRDGVTKAVKQYAKDLCTGRSDSPTAAATKLSVFYWLMPFSCHYDASTMADQNLDQYIERIIRGHANRLDRHKLDSSDVCDTLSCVSTYLRDAGKPQTLVLSMEKLNWNLLPTIALQNGVLFGLGACLRQSSWMTVILVSLGTA